MSSSVARIHKRNTYGKDAYTYYPVLIIGAGASGIVTGCRLKEVLGFDQFRIFDKLSGIGGTWWINRYPGVACDIPAVLYSFSFAPKKDWTTLRPPGPEIAQYMADVCEKYAIVDKIQLNTEVTELRWIEDIEEWEATLTHYVPGAGDLSRSEIEALISREGKHAVYVKTEILRAKIVVTGVGKLVEPNKWPENIHGIESFEGDMVHTARWNGPRRHYPPNNNAQEEVRQIPVDVIILANGYETNKWFHPLRVIGRGGKTLDDIWEERGGAQAYLGIAMDHMPNLFFPFGPNSGTGHTSVFFAIECGVNYSLKLIKPILDGKVSTFEVKEEAEREWTDMIQRNLKNTVFERGSCTSWYHEDSGWNSGTYPFSQIDYYFRRLFPVWHHWTAKYTQKGHNVQRIRAGLTQFALFVIASGLILLQTFPQGFRRSVQFFHGMQSSVGSVVRDGLLQAR